MRQDDRDAIICINTCGSKRADEIKSLACAHIADADEVVILDEVWNIEGEQGIEPSRILTVEGRFPKDDVCELKSYCHNSRA